MQKRIPIDELKIGMKVEKLVRSWLATPFLRHRFTITSAEQIKQLYASGVKQLDVDADDAYQDPGSFVPAMLAETEAIQPISSTLEPEPAAIPLAEELPAARQVYKAAKLIIQQAMEDVRMGRALNMEAVDAVTSDRCYHKGKTPHDTLQLLYRLRAQGHVNGARVQQFLQVVGVYPVGTCVLLNTGETAIVKQFNHYAPIRPLIVLITDEAGHRRSTPVDLDLAAALRQPKRAIASILDPTALGINPSLYLDKEAT